MLHATWAGNVLSDAQTGHPTRPQGGSGEIHRYRLVVLPALFVADDRVAAILEEYVRRGGFLLAEEGIGLRDKRYWMNAAAPGSGLDRLLGASQGKTVKCSSPVMLQLGALELPAVSRRAVLIPAGGQTVAEWPDGGAAIVTNLCGKGSTLLLGFHPGWSYAETRSDALVNAARSWLLDAGIQPAIEVVVGAPGALVQVRAGMSMGRRTLFLLNHEPQAWRWK